MRLGPVALARFHPASAGPACAGADRLAPDSPQIPDSPAAFPESWRGLPAAVLRFSLQSASAVRQDFGFSGRVLSKIPINIAPTIDPLVWAELEG
jgi:hypothetical protein